MGRDRTPAKQMTVVQGSRVQVSAAFRHEGAFERLRPYECGWPAGHAGTTLRRNSENWCPSLLRECAAGIPGIATPVKLGWASRNGDHERSPMSFGSAEFEVSGQVADESPASGIIGVPRNSEKSLSP